MDGLGGYRELSHLARVIGALIFIGILGLTAFLERLQFQLRATEGSVWWASNGRDLINAFAVATLGVGLHVLGFTGPIALGLAATQVILLSALQGGLAGRPKAELVSLAASIALGIPVLFFPQWIHTALRSLIERLFSGA